METISIILPASKKMIQVRLDRKSMKTCRLKVYPSQEVVLSMPKTVPADWVKEFLVDKGTWIESKLDSFQKTVGYAATDEIRDGFSIKLLGEDMLFVVTECDKEKVYLEGKIIHICCNDENNQEKIQHQFENWWRKQAKEILQERIEHWYPIIEKYRIARPQVSVRKMKTLWGSCSVNRGARGIIAGLRVDEYAANTVVVICGGVNAEVEVGECLAAVGGLYQTAAAHSELYA